MTEPGMTRLVSAQGFNASSDALDFGPVGFGGRIEKVRDRSGECYSGRADLEAGLQRCDHHPAFPVLRFVPFLPRIHNRFGCGVSDSLEVLGETQTCQRGAEWRHVLKDAGQWQVMRDDFRNAEEEVAA